MNARTKLNVTAPKTRQAAIDSGVRSLMRWLVRPDGPDGSNALRRQIALAPGTVCVTADENTSPMKLAQRDTINVANDIASEGGTQSETPLTIRCGRWGCRRLPPGAAVLQRMRLKAPHGR